MKKAKLFASIASICFAFAVLIFGIYAAEQVNYQINGTLTYEVSDCYVTVETSVYYSPTSFTQDLLYSKMETIVAGSTEGLTSVPYNNLNYNSYLDTTDGANQKQINLVFEGKKNNSPKQAYFIVMTVTNIGGKAINIGVNTPITLPSNVYSINSGLWTNVGTGTNNAKRLVVAFSLEDKLSPVTPRNGQETTSYSMSLKAENDDEDTTELNVYDFNQSTGTITKTSRTEELAIDLCVPSYVNDHKVTKALDFSDCTQLTSISIPSTVQEMGENIFYNCPNLRSLTLPFVGKKNYDSLQDLLNQEGDYYLRGSLFHLFGSGWGYYNSSDDYNREIIDFEISNGHFSPNIQNNIYGDDTSYEIPRYLTKVELLYGCKCINAYCFGDYDRSLPINNYYIPSSITRVEDYGFFCVDKLNNLDFLIHVDYIGHRAFRYTNVNNLVVYQGVIGDEAFDCCTSLEQITLKEGVTQIGDMAFRECHITSLVVPNTVVSIGDDAFAYVSTLTSVKFPDSLKSIGNSAFSSCTNLRSVTFGEGLETIGNYAFEDTALVSIKFPDSLKSIGECAFIESEFLTNVKFNEGLETIGEEAFNLCTGLTEVIIPASVTYIGTESFGCCWELKTVIFKGGNVNINGESFAPFFYTGDDYLFRNDSGYYIYVPDEYYNRYVNSSNWSFYAENDVIWHLSNLPNEYRVVYNIADGVVDDTYSSGMPYANMLNKLNPDVWHQFNAQVVSRDNMGSYANNIYTNIDGATNAIYTDINLVPSDGIEYSIRAPSGYKIYIYKYAIDSDEFISTSPRVCEFRRSDDKDNYKGIIFGKDVYKIRFILVRFESVQDVDVQNGDREYFDTAVKLIPSQITTSKFTNLYLTATNVDNSYDGDYGAKKLVGYYRPGVAIEMPSIVMSPYKDYDFMGWLADPNDEDSTISSISSEQVVEYGRTTVFAHWSKKVRYLYFKLNYDGTEDYIKVDGISVDSYGTSISIGEILDAVFGMQSIQNLMVSKGITINEDGYPISCDVQKLCMESGTKGCFLDNGIPRDWITRESFYNNSGFRFTSGDAYIYVGEWNVASVNQDVNISNACVCDNDIQNVESASNYTIPMWMQKYNLYFDRVKQSFVSFAKSKVA